MNASRAPLVPAVLESKQAALRVCSARASSHAVLQAWAVVVVRHVSPQQCRQVLRAPAVCTVRRTPPRRCWRGRPVPAALMLLPAGRRPHSAAATHACVCLVVTMTPSAWHPRHGTAVDCMHLRTGLDAGALQAQLSSAQLPGRRHVPQPGAAQLAASSCRRCPPSPPSPVAAAGWCVPSAARACGSPCVLLPDVVAMGARDTRVPTCTICLHVPPALACMPFVCSASDKAWGL